MTRPSGTFRWLVTVLTALCVPLCCCSFESLLQPCASFGAEDAGAQSGCHDDDDDVATLAVCHPHGRQGGEQPAPQHDHKHGACTCGADNKIGTSGASSQVSFRPSVLAYVLPEPFSLQAPGGLLEGVRPDSRAPVKPDQTLLRQHCALIV
jgi:hypothetical protein